MRYREGEEAGISPAMSDTMTGALAFSVTLAFIIACILLVLGVRAKILWLTAWSAGLLLCSIAYFVYVGFIAPGAAT